MLQESIAHPVPPRLAPYVTAMVGYRHEGLAPGMHRGLADRRSGFDIVDERTALGRPNWFMRRVALAASSEPRRTW